MARPTKYSPEVVRRICDAIAIGATYQHAAAYGGVHYDTFNEWRQDPDKPEFSEALLDAEGRGVVALLMKIRMAADKGDWRPAAWILERRYPQLYGRSVQELEHSGAITQHHAGAIEVRAIDYRHSIAPLMPLADPAATRPGERPLGLDPIQAQADDQTQMPAPAPPQAQEEAPTPRRVLDAWDVALRGMLGEDD